MKIEHIFFDTKEQRAETDEKVTFVLKNVLLC